MDSDEQFEQTLTMGENTTTFGEPSSDGYYLVPLLGAMIGKAFPFDDIQHVVGRSEQADITLAECRVSGRHFQIRATVTEVLVEDLGSQNGTYVRGSRIFEPTILSPGETLTVGNTVLFIFNGTGDTLQRMIRALCPVFKHLEMTGMDLDIKGLKCEDYLQELLTAQRNIQDLAVKLQNDILTDPALRVTNENGVWYCPWCRELIREGDVKSDFGLTQSAAYAISRHLLRNCESYREGKTRASEEELKELLH